MNQQVILTKKAPQPIGPYSQAITFGQLQFCSGQIALDPENGQMIAGGVEEQTERVMKNLQAVLVAAGTDLSRVVKTTIFLKSMAAFPKVNQIYGSFFTGTGSP